MLTHKIRVIKAVRLAAQAFNGALPAIDMLGGAKEFTDKLETMLDDPEAIGHTCPPTTVTARLTYQDLTDYYIARRCEDEAREAVYRAQRALDRAQNLAREASDKYALIENRLLNS